MSLQDDAGRAFPSGRGEFGEQQVARCVGARRDAALAGPVLDVTQQRALVFRGTGNGAERGKMPPDGLRFEGVENGIHRHGKQ
ncbi:MAG: hypothetical protein LBU11_10220 [Zoogloeaceae bacterium]|jgi:hypothetical protein|nr:hypothetical protein [Zoogloeaceae bacterium]